MISYTQFGYDEQFLELLAGHDINSAPWVTYMDFRSVTKEQCDLSIIGWERCVRDVLQTARWQRTFGYATWRVMFIYDGNVLFISYTCIVSQRYTWRLCLVNLVRSSWSGRLLLRDNAVYLVGTTCLLNRASNNAREGASNSALIEHICVSVKQVRLDWEQFCSMKFVLRVNWPPILSITLPTWTHAKPLLTMDGRTWVLV